MKFRTVLPAFALVLLSACGEDPIDIQDQGSLQAINMTRFAVLAWDYRACGGSAYNFDISLRRLEGGRIPPGSAATVQIEGDRCFDHRFTLEDGSFIEELGLTVPKLDTRVINIAQPEGTGRAGEVE